jgi:hypothetical protein
MDRLTLSIGLGLLAAFGGIIWYAAWDDRRWQKYATEHHCKRTGSTKEQVMFTTQSCGNNCWMTVPHFYTQYEYACDGGERIWR